MANVSLLGRFARNRLVRRDTKPPLNRRKLATDPQLREVVAIAIGARLRALTSRDTNVDERETVFTTATLQAAEALLPQRNRTTLGHEWSEDAQTGGPQQGVSWEARDLAATRK